MERLSNILNGAKAKAVAVGSAVVVATSSQAEVTFNQTTGAFEGAIDLGAYYSGVEIAIAVVAITIATGLVFKALRRAG